MIEAGRLRHRVTIQQLTETQDPVTGEMSESWSTFATVWAAVEPVSTKEFVAAASTQGQLTARIIIRYLAGVTEDMRVVHGAKTYELTGPPLADVDSGREYLTLMVKGVVA